MTPAGGGGLDHLVVADGAAGLDDRADAGVDQDLRAVGEREERVGGGERALRAVAGPGDGQLAGVHPVDLAHADTYGGAVAGEQDGVGLHRTAGAPRERQVGQLGVGERLAAGEGPGRGVVASGVDHVAPLEQQTAGDRPQVVAAAPQRRADEQPDVLLGLEDLHRSLVVRRRDQHLGEDLGHLGRHLHRHRHVGSDHASERRRRVTLVSLAVCLGHVGADRNAARVGVLDDRDGRLVEVVRRPPSRVAVDVVVVGHLLAVQLRRLRQAGLRLEAVGEERGALVRVLAVAQHRLAVPRRAHPGRVAGPLGGVGEHVAHPRGHVHVVRRGVDEGLCREPLALGQREPAGADRLQHVGVAVGRGDDRDRRVVLRGRAHHRRAADVDLLHALVGAGAAHHGLGERVQVRHHQVERLDPEVGKLLHVGLEPAVGEDAGVHLGVQRLHPAVEALGEAGQVLDPGHRQPELLDQRGGAAGGDQRHAGVVKPAHEVLEPGLVVDGDECPPDRDPVVGGLRGDVLVVTPLLSDPDLPVLDGEAFGQRACRALDEHHPLGGLDPFVEGLDGVVVLDGHRGLGDDRPGVDTGVDDEQRRTGHLHAVLERVRRPCIPGNDGSSAGWVLR